MNQRPPTPHVEPPFAVVVVRRPVSLQTSARSKQNFQAALAQAAGTVRPANLLAGPLYLRIVWFCVRSSADVDNIIKPIGDALKEIVYKDDNTIVKVAAERVITRTPFSIDANGVPGRAELELRDALTEAHQDIVYVEVGELAMIPSRGVSLGPIDRRAP